MACVGVFLGEVKKRGVPPHFLGRVEPITNGAPPPRGSPIAHPHIDYYILNGLLFSSCQRMYGKGWDGTGIWRQSR